MHARTLQTTQSRQEPTQASKEGLTKAARGKESPGSLFLCVLAATLMLGAPLAPAIAGDDPLAEILSQSDPFKNDPDAPSRPQQHTPQGLNRLQHEARARSAMPMSPANPAPQLRERCLEACADMGYERNRCQEGC